MITREDVRHIARLARIELTEGEEANLEQELSAILDFVAKLDEVDTAHVEPMTGGTELTNVMRDDIAWEAGSGKLEAGLVEAAPRRRGEYVEVPQVFERE